MLNKSSLIAAVAVAVAAMVTSTAHAQGPVQVNP